MIELSQKCSDLIEHRLNAIDDWIRCGEDKTLENVLGEWSPIHDAQYADPQARIFGLPGILTSISHNDSSVFEADYEKSAQDVYSEIAQYS